MLCLHAQLAGEVAACLFLDPQIPVKIWQLAQPQEAFPEAAGSGLALTQLWEQARSHTASQTVQQRPPQPGLLEVGPQAQPVLSWALPGTVGCQHVLTGLPKARSSTRQQDCPFTDEGTEAEVRVPGARPRDP